MKIQKHNSLYDLFYLNDATTFTSGATYIARKTGLREVIDRFICPAISPSLQLQVKYIQAGL